MSARVTALLAVLGALGIALTGVAVQAAPVQAIGWAAAAGVGLSAMLRGPGLQVMGALGTVLAVAGALTAALSGGWAWVAVFFAVALGVASVLTLLRAQRWRSSRARRSRPPVRDLWKRFDAGDDPTTDAEETSDHELR